LYFFKKHWRTPVIPKLALEIKMKPTIARALAFGFSTLALCSASFAGDVTITNSSDWELHHLYISAVDKQVWGEDQLGEQTIATGERFTLKGVPCGSYDVKLVDEDGDECEVSDVDICGNGGWNINSDDLLECQSETAE
jgi:hypothetical protein